MSVVIPCYNYGRFLRQCVNSVLYDQPGIEVEVIIVDDKSTDDSLTTAREIELKHANVKVIANDVNLGHIKTYNRGLDAATSPYVLLISADDLVTPGALTRAAELLEAEPSVGMVYGRSIDFHKDLPPCRTEQSSWIVWRGADWLRHRCQSGYNVIASPEVVMRTAVLRATGGYRSDLPHAGDFEMWLRTSAVSDVGFLVGVDQAFHRGHDRNMNRTMFKSGSEKGRLIDLKQRWQSFEVVFDGVGRGLAEGALLHKIARETMARQALEHINYAYARGFRDFPMEDFETFAKEVDPMVEQTRLGRRVARRKRLGMVSLPLHPLWALPAAHWRLKELLRRWRRAKIGV
ncbi:glycosyltransferase family 2 protein [Rhizobium sp. PL01]|uniref:glycosyltransferase family 2 protein n=1 Tax=Rhizobium sp. PL01 TaxID=3085631 RepID=UPI0029816BEB|nr:glycosyltransferase [Rhizobium sp. PL01]MDW5317027.1 glycosyltransferase [Rhizobium sp. PL01]